MAHSRTQGSAAASRLTLIGIFFCVGATDAVTQVQPIESGGSGLRQSIGVGGVEGILTLAYRWSWGRQGPGFELGLLTAPEVLSSGGLLLMPQVGPTLWLPGGPVRPFLKGGVGAALLLANEFGGGVSLAYLGGGLLITGESGLGLRLDWTSLGAEGEWVSLFEVAVSWSSGGTRAPPA